MPMQVVWEEGRGMGVEVSNFIDKFFLTNYSEAFSRRKGEEQN